MQVDEILMRPGEFRFSLRPSTPKGLVRNELRDAARNADGLIAVFDTRPTTPRLANARYVGWLRERPDISTFAGMGLSALLQSDDDLGRHVEDSVSYTEQGLSAWLDVVLPWGGLSKGTVTTTGLVDAAAEWTAGQGARELLDEVCAAVGGAVWRVNTDLTVDAGPRDVVFNSTPSVIVDRAISVEATAGLRGIRGGITALNESSRHVTSRAIGYGRGTDDAIETSTYTNPGTLARGADGLPLQIDRPVNLPTSTGDELDRLTQATAEKFNAYSRGFEVTTRSRGVRRFVEPGDVAFMHDRLGDVVGDVLVPFAGEPIRPVEGVLETITWQVHPGQGVWLIRPNEARPFTELSPWIEYGDGSSTWLVTTGWSLSDIVLINGPKRIETTAPSLPTPAAAAAPAQSDLAGALRPTKTLASTLSGAVRETGGWG